MLVSPTPIPLSRTWDCLLLLHTHTHTHTIPTYMYVMHTCMYTHSYTSQDGSSLPVKQFQYTGWPEEGVPDVGTGLIDLVGQVQKWQRNSGTHPIVVHCSGGSGRTGTFIAISILLERLKTEGVVDVFHTGRTLRLQRPGLIQTVVSFFNVILHVTYILHSTYYI